MGFLAEADVPAGTAVPSKAGIVGMVRDVTSIKSVADATARAQAVTDWPTASGAAISAANPVIVYRQDTDTIELSEDGTNWIQWANTTDTGWVSVTMNTGWTSSTVYVRKTGNVVRLRGQVRNDSAIVPSGDNADVATLAATYRPAAVKYLVGAGWVSGGTAPVYRPQSVTIGTDGGMDVSANGNQTFVYLDGISYTTD